MSPRAIRRAQRRKAANVLAKDARFWKHYDPAGALRTHATPVDRQAANTVRPRKKR